MNSTKNKAKITIPSNVIKKIVAVSITGLVSSYLVASTVVNAMRKADANPQKHYVEVVDGKR